MKYNAIKEKNIYSQPDILDYQGDHVIKQHYKPLKSRARFLAVLALVLMVVGVISYYISAPLMIYESDITRLIQGCSAVVGMGFAALLLSGEISILEDKIKVLEKNLNKKS